MSKRVGPVAFPRNAMTWIDAVLASSAGTKVRVLRLANALMFHCDMTTCRTWVGVAKLMQRSRIHDRDNFNKARRFLQDIGALKVHPISTLPGKDRGLAMAVKDPEGKWYELDLDWATRVLSEEVKSTLPARSNQPSEQGHTHLAGKVKSTPHISQGSPKDLPVDLPMFPSCGPADDGSAALSFASSLSSLRSDSSASVTSETAPKDKHPVDEDSTINTDRDPLPIPESDHEAVRMIDTLCQGAVVNGDIRARMKVLLLDGRLTIELARRFRGDKERAA